MTLQQLNFHGEDVVPAMPEDALFHIIPVPFEISVSYGRGTAYGPAAILEASRQLELFTGRNIPAEHGIYTVPPVNCSGSCEDTLRRIEEQVATTLSLKKIPVVLGGEHTVTCGVIEAFRKQHEDFGVIQFDAHADLRDSYEGSSYSHACVMRRIHEKNIPIYQLGTRSYSVEEHRYREEHNVPYRDSEDIWKNGTDLLLPEDFPNKVFITFDIDGLDGSVIPATGTPVPGGLDWYQAMWLIEAIMQSRVCIGFDVVELAPVDNLHGPNFAAAQLVYNMMSYLTDSKLNRDYWQLTR
ncbi:agmatinase [Desulfopila sp. IMCC35008]|uniref:agmatinase n=1 Tax=Desulfopila sp. IMCC35008 TaxID=2653858 RepID=UPI0013D2857F|nr:agmatinase [Desulfopila sp. IMCC35008]